MTGLTPEQRAKGVICSSAGNHAQGVALAAHKLVHISLVIRPLPLPVHKLHIHTLHCDVTLGSPSRKLVCSLLWPWLRQHTSRYMLHFIVTSGTVSVTVCVTRQVGFAALGHTSSSFLTVECTRRVIAELTCILAQQKPRQQHVKQGWQLDQVLS